MNLKTNDWEIYAIIRECSGKEKAEEYKQRMFQKYKKYGILRQNENNDYNFVKAFGEYDSYTLKCFCPCFFSDAKKKKFVNKLKYPFIIPRMTVPGKNSPPGLIFIKCTTEHGYITA